MNLTRSLAATMLVAGAAAAQITTDAKLHSAAGASATAGTASDFQTAPSGTPIGPTPYTWRLRAEAGDSRAGLSASSSMWAARHNDNNGVQMGMTGITRGPATSADGHFTPSSSPSGKPGPIQFLIRIRNTANAAGVIAITWQTLLEGTATAAASVDVGNDSSVEWQAGDVQGKVVTANVPVTFPASGQIDVLISMDGTTTGPGGFDFSSLYGRLTAKFVDQSAGKCTLTPYGMGCSGAQVAAGVIAVGNDHVISLKMTGGFANAFVIEAVGTQPINLPLPGGCALLCNANVVLVHPTNAQGEYATSHKVSRYISSTAYHQFLPIDMVGPNLAIKATNALKIVCTGS